MPFVTTADAVDRETDFLTTTGDGLPALLVADGGKWDVIQAYVPRTPAQRQNQIWVTRPDFVMARTANQRTMPTYAFELRLLWTLSSVATQGPESDQRAFDVAINDVVMRVLGQPPPSMDKTHSKFLSAAENPRHVQVRYVPVEPPISGAFFAATVTYSADDYELND